MKVLRIVTVLLVAAIGQLHGQLTACDSLRPVKLKRSDFAPRVLAAERTWTGYLTRALGATGPFPYGPTDVKAVDSLWRADSVLTTWFLALLVADNREVSQEISLRARAQYNRLSRAPQPMLVALLDSPAMERRHLGLSAIEGLQTSQQEQIVMNFACDAYAVLTGLATYHRLNSVASNVLRINAETLFQGRRLLTGAYRTSVESLIKEVDAHLAAEFRE